MNRAAVQRALRWGGRALAILGLVFVALRLRTYSGEIDFGRLGWSGWAAIGGFSLLYAVASLLLALAWGDLLRHFGAPVPQRWAISTYGVAQISKYVPGNIFHLAARQARGMTAGLAGWPLAKSAIWEIALLAACGALFGFLVLPLVWLSVPVYVALALFLAALFSGGALLTRFGGAHAARALGRQAGFLVTSGLLFLGILLVLDVSGLQEGWIWIAALGAYVVAWLAGLLTPGAPAGLGVREMVLLLLLPGFVDEPRLIQAVVLGRLVSVAGDIVFFLGALLLREEGGASAVPAPEED